MMNQSSCGHKCLDCHKISWYKYLTHESEIEGVCMMYTMHNTMDLLKHTQEDNKLNFNFCVGWNLYLAICFWDSPAFYLQKISSLHVILTADYAR